jgi:hypothetical protein
MAVADTPREAGRGRRFPERIRENSTASDRPRQTLTRHSRERASMEDAAIEAGRWLRLTGRVVLPVPSRRRGPGPRDH